MVHALEQAWQVLHPGGMLLDLRPRSFDSPVDVVADDLVEHAGMVDMSADLPDDQASDEAIEAAVRAGVFVPIQARKFEFSYYWSSLEGMREYTQERWETAVFPADVLGRARSLLEALGPEARIRIILPMHLATYEKPRAA